MYGSSIFSGNPYGVETTPMLIIASLANFFFWTLVCYAAPLSVGFSKWFRQHIISSAVAGVAVQRERCWPLPAANWCAPLLVAIESGRAQHPTA
jgi:hypothetical protein